MFKGRGEKQKLNRNFVKKRCLGCNKEFPTLRNKGMVYCAKCGKLKAV